MLRHGTHGTHGTHGKHGKGAQHARYGTVRTTRASGKRYANLVLALLDGACDSTGHSKVRGAVSRPWPLALAIPRPPGAGRQELAGSSAASTGAMPALLSAAPLGNGGQPRTALD